MGKRVRWAKPSTGEMEWERGKRESGGWKEGSTDTNAGGGLKGGSDGRRLKGELWESAFRAERAPRLTFE